MLGVLFATRQRTKLPSAQAKAALCRQSKLLSNVQIPLAHIEVSSALAVARQEAAHIAAGMLGFNHTQDMVETLCKSLVEN